MDAKLIVIVALAFLAVVTVVPAEAGADPFGGGGSCGGIHWHKGDVTQGEKPLWPHYHYCI